MKKSFPMEKILISFVLSFLITLMSVLGWQSSVKYKTIFLGEQFSLERGYLSLGQGILFFAVGTLIFSAFFFFLFSMLDRRSGMHSDKEDKMLAFWWLIPSAALFIIYVFLLWCCYPGYYNYDMGNQLPQMLYKDVPFNAHHPLLHTIVGGGIIKIGYHIKNTDLTFGVFLYNLAQAAISALGFGYCLGFVYRKCKNWLVTALGFLFFAFCPSIVIFGMSTTKDVPCYVSLLVAVLLLYEIYENLQTEKEIPLIKWILAGSFLMLSCLLRKNIIYAVVVFACAVIFWVRKSVKKQILLYLIVMAGYFIINNALILGLHAPRSSSAEALSVPFQQMARYYHEFGEKGYTSDELDLLYCFVDQEMLFTYDPVNADNIKTSFWLHMDTISENKGAFLKLWAKKGLQHPGVYLQATIDNTYQAWYPFTKLMDKRKNRYVDITYWQEEFGRSHVKGLADFYAGTNEHNYVKIPLLCLLFTTGTFVWMLFIALAYSIWQRDKSGTAILFLVFLVTGTSLCGPVMDIRYFLIVLYLFPVYFALMLKRDKGNFKILLKHIGK